MENSATFGRKLDMVHIPNDLFPERSGYDLSNSASESAFSCSAGLEGVSSKAYPLLSSMSTSEVLHLLDEHVHCIVDPWIGSIPFAVFKWDKSKGNVSEIFCDKCESVDIATFLNGQSYPTELLYFCPKTYPPPHKVNEPLPKELNSFVHLRRDMEKSAHGCGNPILCNGGFKSTSGHYCKTFKCSYCYRNRRESFAKGPTSEMPFRLTSLTHDRKNSRDKAGKRGVKRVKMTRKSEICKFNFSVFWDLHGYYVNLHNKGGNNIHNGHPKHHDPLNVPIPTRLLDADEEETVNHVVESACNKAAGRNYMFKRFGKFISSMKVAYLNRKSNGDNDTAGNDIASMLDNFHKSDEICFTTLSDVPKLDFSNDNFSGSTNVSETHDPTIEEDSITLSTTKHPNGRIVNLPLSDISSMKGIEPLVKLERSERNLSHDDILFVSIAWTVLPALRLFMLCPEVFWVDVTSHSNSKGFDLVTFSCKTSVGKQCVFLWIWIPNQKRFSFRWVFSHALRMLIPCCICERVKLIMKDGDAQQRNEILREMDCIFLNAIKGRCRWHIGKYFCSEV